MTDALLMYRVGRWFQVPRLATIACMFNEDTFKRVLSLRSIRDIEAEDEPLAKVEEDGDPGDWGSEAEDEEAENSENAACESTTESAAAWLDPLPKDQAILKKEAQGAAFQHYGLKCPGPGRVVDLLVLGTQPQNPMHILPWALHVQPISEDQLS
ncbi:hypothetical protein PENDEC_c010G03039 [Penicillium decumbens]|uniref:Uncharacterized protein n=1 Tax=Penicillium decumbens TaxID=69771 RepID=A0A1V6PBX3_PENDC|nr:hypothetical protein PENDEC_c010G03039 [Penicillium decumbens]